MVAEDRKVVSVEVVAIHPTFGRLCDDLAAIHHAPRVYHEIEHPWFADWQVMRPGRPATLRAFLDKQVASGSLFRGENALDVGCYLGRISRELVRAGFCTVGLDNDNRILDLCGRLTLLFRTTFRSMYADVTEVHPIEGKEYGVSVVLSVFHHFLKDRIASIDRLLKNLGWRSRVLIVDVPSLEDAWTCSAIPLGEVEGHYRQVLKRHRVEVLGVHQGRKMLAFWRTCR
jgi:SAM-dependent methyltransferase